MTRRLVGALAALVSGIGIGLGIGLGVPAPAGAQPPPPAPVPGPLPFESIPGLGPVAAPVAVPPPVPGAQPAPPPAGVLFPLAQNGSPSQLIGGLPAMPDVSGQTANEFVLGQHAVPAVPGTAPAAPIHMNPFNNAYLLPQNLAPSAPGAGQLFGIAPGQENADIAGIEYLKRLYDMYQAGGLQGGLLGQRELDSLNKPLPVAPVPPPPAP